MKEIFLGEAIRQRRIELGLTQEELAEGICEPATMSRLENGRQTPSRNNIKAILFRLGLPDDRFFGLLNDHELQISNLENEIISCTIRFERSQGETRQQARQEALSLHRQLEAILKPEDILSRQLILRTQYLLGKEDGPYTFEEEKAMLLDAIRMTSPRFDLNHINLGLYSGNEVMLINNLANCHIRAGLHYDAIDILKQLLLYTEEHLQKIPANHSFLPLVVYNYARELSQVGRIEDALRMAEKGKSICINYGHYQLLPALLAILANCHFQLGETEESKALYRQSYYLFTVLDDIRNRELIRKDAEELLDLHFD